MASVAAATATAYVPQRMELPATWTDLSTSTVSIERSSTSVGLSYLTHLNLMHRVVICYLSFQLVPLEFQTEAAAALEGPEASLVSESACMSASDVLAKHSGKHGSIAFAVRRPGERKYSCVENPHQASLFFYDDVVCNILCPHLTLLRNVHVAG